MAITFKALDHGVEGRSAAIGAAVHRVADSIVLEGKEGSGRRGDDVLLLLLLLLVLREM